MSVDPQLQRKGYIMLGQKTLITIANPVCTYVVLCCFYFCGSVSGGTLICFAVCVYG